MSQAIMIHALKLILTCSGDHTGIAIDEHRIPSGDREYRKITRRIRAAVKKSVASIPENIQKVVCMASPGMPERSDLAVIRTGITSEGKWRVELWSSSACDTVPGLTMHLQGVCDRVLQEVTA